MPGRMRGAARTPAQSALDDRVAGDGEVIVYESAGQSWAVSWHRPDSAPAGTPHGANAFCVTDDAGVVLISRDGKRWGWPGGRPEGAESWADTLRRETLEETCSRVAEARLLGFTRSTCQSGHESGLVLVRGIWRAEVDLLPWRPRFEIPWRRVVPIAELGDHLWMEDGLEPIFRRAVVEAGIPPWWAGGEDGPSAPAGNTAAKRR